MRAHPRPVPAGPAPPHRRSCDPLASWLAPSIQSPGIAACRSAYPYLPDPTHPTFPRFHWVFLKIGDRDPSSRYVSGNWTGLVAYSIMLLRSEIPAMVQLTETAIGKVREIL